ncbi:MAG: hypothetical protein KatS3mg088_305 [Patescibacteria group bacterium]|nr:MAG: hypothetical protein KatS3mg088_305 [Patescibacteria group bacterium]
MGGKLPAQTYHRIQKDKIDSEFYRNKLKLKSFEVERNLKEKYPDFWSSLSKSGLDLSKIREHSSRILSSSILAGALLFSYPQEKIQGLPSFVFERTKDQDKDFSGAKLRNILVSNLEAILPKRIRPLLPQEEALLEKLFSQVMGIKAKATLDSQHLNTTYGLIGIEQHLRRYPGDTLRDHTSDLLVIKEGMAPGLGAWGYFAPSKEKLTQELIDIEKWYAVVQTLYLPDWNTNQPFLKNWYKYRKVLIVNTQNGRAVVAAIADSGPAAWTGKSFGGSPEVMNYLGGPSYKKGPVILFFIDESEREVPLGPVEYDKIDFGDNLIKT